MKKDAVILFLSDSNGIHIPQMFCEQIDRKYVVEGVEYIEQMEKLRLGDYFYWDVWQDILDKVVIQKDGQTFHVYQDGDLWLIDYENMTSEEKHNFGFED